MTVNALTNTMEKLNMTEPMKPGEIIDAKMELLEDRVLYLEARLDGIEGMLADAGIKQTPTPGEAEAPSGVIA
ncbi:MAG: hypothetical protein K1X57_19035 [Gemmataceae bacterium]|nr:hypothetical protein [Gemmataceae bacterium]